MDGVRTPFCKSWGALDDAPADELCRIAIGEAMARVDLDPLLVDEVIIGNIAQPAEATNVARVVALRAGKKIEYDAANMRVKNVPAANQYFEREARAGWSV